jgi:hypothetical protein
MIGLLAGRFTGYNTSEKGGNKMMMRIVAMGFGILLSVIALDANGKENGRPVQAHEAPSVPQEQWEVIKSAQFEGIVRGIFDEAQQTRSRATSQMRVIPGWIRNELRSKLAEPSFWANRGAEGSSVLALGVIGQWRLAEFAPTLAQHITFEVDRATLRAGASYTPSFFYPAASALVEIGGKETRQAVLQKLGNTKEEKERRLCLWVLIQNEGAEWTEILLTTTIQNMQNEGRTKNLQEALQLLRTEKNLLPVSHLAPL